MGALFRGVQPMTWPDSQLRWAILGTKSEDTFIFEKQ